MSKITRLFLIPLSISIAGLASCGGYKGNVEIKARQWADGCGCDKISEFTSHKFVEGTATQNNGEVFAKPTKAAYGEYSFNCYYVGVGWHRWTFSVFLLQHPITEHDFGFLGDEGMAQRSAVQSGFKPN